jgi:hypothetical protein
MAESLHRIFVPPIFYPAGYELENRNDKNVHLYPIPSFFARHGQRAFWYRIKILTLTQINLFAGTAQTVLIIA